MLASRLRVNGYKVALQQHRIPFDKDLVEHTKFLQDQVVAALDRWLDLKNPPDGICTVYDAGAIKLIELLKQKGIKIPDEIAVAGFGDDPAASIIEPGLTSYMQKPYEIGVLAGKYMLDLLNKKYPVHHSDMTICKGALVVRRSSSSGISS